MIGGKFNLRLRKEIFLNIGLSFTRQIYHIEGYFVRQNHSDYFIQTPNNIKVNSISAGSPSLEVGYTKVIENKMTIGVELQAMYLKSFSRKYKIDNTTFDEDYNLSQNLKYKLNGLMGLFVSKNKNLKIELFFDYYLSSLAGNTNFRPLNAGLRMAFLNLFKNNPGKKVEQKL